MNRNVPSFPDKRNKQNKSTLLPFPLLPFLSSFFNFWQLHHCYLLTRVNTAYVKMAESILTEPKSTPSGLIIVFIGRSSAAPGEQVKREWLLETLHWVEQMHLEEYGSLDSRSVDFIPFIQGSNQPLQLSGVVMTKLSADFQEARANAGCNVICDIWLGRANYE